MRPIVTLTLNPTIDASCQAEQSGRFTLIFVLGDGPSYRLVSLPEAPTTGRAVTGGIVV
jgi:hypothetical protein